MLLPAPAPLLSPDSELRIAPLVSTIAAPPTTVVTERIHALDILRGFALFGMIVVHFHQRVNTEATGLEGLIGWIVWVGLETKAWGAFAFLFGAGFAVLLRRAEDRGVPFFSFYLRRLAVLAVFGLVAEAFFGFSVLLSYAMWGVPLLFLRRVSTPALLALAGSSVVARPLLSFASSFGAPSSASGEAASGLRQTIETANLQGDYLELVVARIRWMTHAYLQPETLLPDVTLALFILGMLAVRHHLVDRPRENARTIVAWMMFGFLSWAFYWTVLYPIGTLPWQLQRGFGLLNEQWLCLTFVGGVLLLTAYRPVWKQRLAWSGWAGRMALTNYMLQIAVLDFLVSGYGLSLRLRPLLGMLAAGLLFAVEVVFSRFWLGRYRFGPLEWLWRSATYGTAQPLRREVELPDSPSVSPPVRPSS